MNENILALLVDLFDSNGIGTFGWRTDNGLDTYNCPECGAKSRIKGYCSPTSSIRSVEHHIDCKLVQLHNAVFNREIS
jgi:hypothetical protein